jgi:monoamine oxidase
MFALEGAQGRTRHAARNTGRQAIGRAAVDFSSGCYMSLASDVDVAVIGAGAAGIASARTLASSGLSVVVLEARDRIGGRALTKSLAGGIVFDVGCEWLHSADRNALLRIAQSLQFDIAEAPPHWVEQSYNINFPLEQQREFLAALEAFYVRVELAAEAGVDTAAAEFLEPGNPWNPLIDAISTYVNGAELCRVSVHDIEEYLDTNLNWRVRQGLGMLIHTYGSDCNVALRTEVRSIDHSGRDIALETSQGALRAHRVIYTLPTSLAAEQAVRFNPELPDKIAAAAGLPLGHAEKVMLAVAGAEEFPEEGHLFGATDRVATGSYDLRPLGQPCIEAFFGGTFARELATAGELENAAIDELVALFGSSFRDRILHLAASNWTRDQYARGSYSHALPGHSGARAMLAAPVDDRLFFAGEATSTHFFSTAHGAYESGVRAAGEILRTVAPQEGHRFEGHRRHQR